MSLRIWKTSDFCLYLLQQVKAKQVMDVKMSNYMPPPICVQCCPPYWLPCPPCAPPHAPSRDPCILGKFLFPLGTPITHAGQTLEVELTVCVCHFLIGHYSPHKHY